LTPLVYALLLLLALLLVWWGVRLRTSRRTELHAADALDTVTGWAPQATRVLTTAERQVYDLLRNALPAHMILAQVPLQRFIKVPTRNSYAEWLRRVGQVSVDMLVCDRYSQVMAVVEVTTADEVPSDRAQRRRDRLMKVLKAAEVPVHVWSANALPSVEAVRAAIVVEAPEEDEQVPSVPSSATRSLPGRFISTDRPPRLVAKTEPGSDGALPLREPPPSTWFDDFDSAPAPLAGEPPVSAGEETRRLR